MYRVIAETDGRASVIHNTRDFDPKIIGGELVEGINTFPSFSFTILPSNPQYDELRPMATTITVRDKKKNKEIFAGRVLTVEDSMDEDGRISKVATCEGELAYLCDVKIPYMRVTTGSVSLYMLRGFIDYYNERVPQSRRFKVGECMMAGLPRIVELENVSIWEAFNALLIEPFGGEFRIRHESGERYIDFLESIGEVSPVEIKLARNMKSISRTRDLSGLATRVIPLGGYPETESGRSQRRLTIESARKSGGLDYIANTALEKKYPPIEKIVIYDDILDPDELYEKGASDADKLSDSASSFAVKALDLSETGLDFAGYELGNWHIVNNRLMGIRETLRIVQKTTLLDDRKNSELTFGSKLETLTAQTARQNGGQQVSSKLLSSQSQISSIIAAMGGLSHRRMTASEYERISPDPNTVYWVVLGERSFTIYLGSLPLAGGGDVSSRGYGIAIPDLAGVTKSSAGGVRIVTEEE